MSKESKIQNLKTQKEKNTEKIKKLLGINLLIDEQITKLGIEPVKVTITEEEKANQSKIDSQNFKTNLESVSSKVSGLGYFN